METQCPHCKKSQMRKPSDLTVYGLSMTRWFEYQCIGCKRWTHFKLNSSEGLELISRGCRFVQVRMPRERANERVFITEAYISDWEFEADDDPLYVAVLQKEETCN